MSAIEAPAWPTQLPQHLSATQLSMAARCPEQYRQRYILGKKERPGSALIIGAADHKAHEHNFRQKITTKQDLPLADVEDAYAQAFDDAIDNAGGESEIAWMDDNYSKAKDSGASLVRLYHTTISPGLVPDDVEKKIELAIPSLPIPVIGYVDLETSAAIFERKTTKRAEKDLKGDWRLQGLVYRAALGKPVNWHVSVRKASPEILTPATHPNLRLDVGGVDIAHRYIGRLAQQLHALFLMYGPDETWPGAITHPWACGFCGYRSACSWWAS
jgi:hypothetical protein